MTTQAVAAALNSRGIATPSGGPWSAMAVSRVRKRLAASAAERPGVDAARLLARVA